MTWSPGIPAVVDALVVRFTAVFTADPELADVVVRDGPLIGSTSAMQVLYVGWSGADEEADAESEFAPEGLGSDDREAMTIRCAADIATGSTDVAAARVRAFQLVAAAGAALKADPRLGGLGMRAMVSGTSLRYVQGAKGLEAIAAFTVDVDGYTRR